MAVLACGLNHLTAPLEVREKIAFPAEQLRDALARLLNGPAREAAILSTCNRTEIYCATDRAPGAVLEWLAQAGGIDVGALERQSYLHHDADAVRHLMRVASGLDSQVIGEPQILGQVKTAYDVALQAGALGPELKQLGQVALATAKRVRTETDIGRNPISVAYAAVSLAGRIFDDLGHSQALLIGAGDTIELVARHLREAGVHRMVIANRTLDNARDLAATVGGTAITLGEIPGALAQSDIVIASTGSQTPVLGKGTVEWAIRQRRRRPIFMVDIAVPRDIEPQVGSLPDVYLYTIEDLTAIIEENVDGRRQAAQAAELLIDEGVARYLEALRVREMSHLIRAFRGQGERLREQELERALARLANGEPAEAVLGQLARNLTNKLLHHPTVGLRHIGATGSAEAVQLAHALVEPDDGTVQRDS